MSSFLRSLPLLIGLPLAVYFGMIAGVDGARHLVLFYVWAMALPVGLISLFDVIQIHIAKRPAPHPIRKFVGQVVTWGSLGVLIWTGYIVTAVAYAISMVCIAIANDGIRKYREGAAGKEQEAQHDSN
jgi:hypothetical protein